MLSRAKNYKAVMDMQICGFLPLMNGIALHVALKFADLHHLSAGCDAGGKL